MKLNNSDLILYFIHIVEHDSDPKQVYTKEDLAKALNISGSTLNVYLSQLSTQNLIIRKKRHYVKNFIDTVNMTEEGKDKLYSVMDTIESVSFTPERHNIDSIIRYKDIITKINNPLDRVFLLSLYFKSFKFDLYTYLSNLKLVRDDSTLDSFLFSIDHDNTDKESNFISAIYNMSLYGDQRYDSADISTQLTHSDVNALIILGETLMKKGELDNSLSLFNYLLHPEHGITQFQWFLINVGMIKIHNRSGEHEKVMDTISDLENQTKDRIFLAYLKQLKAIEIGERRYYDESIKLFSSAIRSYHNFGYPLLLSLGYSNRGYIYFLHHKFDLAEKDWKSARKYAVKAKSKYSEAKIIGNLADCEIEKGNFSLAKRYLNDAESIFWSLNDIEGVAMIAFNRGLFHLAKKEYLEAVEQYTIFESIGRPLPGPYLSNVLRQEFVDRARKYGFDDVDNYL